METESHEKEKGPDQVGSVFGEGGARLRWYTPVPLRSLLVLLCTGTWLRWGPWAFPHRAIGTLPGPMGQTEPLL